MIQAKLTGDLVMDKVDVEAVVELQYAVVSTAKTDDVSLYYRAIVVLHERLRKGMEQKA